MKRLPYSVLFTLLLAVLMMPVQSQTNRHMAYQAVVRDATGQVIVNQELPIRISILDKSDDPVTYYQEEHLVTTNEYGLVNFPIGGGKTMDGKYADIPWKLGNLLISIKADVYRSGRFTDLGETALLSVPYALHAFSVAENSTDQKYQICEANH